MARPAVYHVDFESITISARNKQEALAIILQRLEEGYYPELFIQEEVRPTLRKWPPEPDQSTN